MDNRNLLNYVGDISQVAGIKDYTFNEGWAKGVRALEVENGSGLRFTVLPDRGMDIARLSFGEFNLSYLSKTKIKGPQYYNNKGDEFLRNFYAGFLTTCGLRNVGGACTYENEDFGTHGRIANIPAYEVYGIADYDNDELKMKLGGKLRQAKVFGENLELKREIISTNKTNTIKINDAVTNLGFRDEAVMILYHFNLGYPLLNENSEVIIPSLNTNPRDEEAKKGIEDYEKCQMPTLDYKEQVFYHTPKTDKNGKTYATLINNDIEKGVVIRFNTNQLKHLIQWKQMGRGEYVVGLEPANCLVGGRKEACENNEIEILKPGQVKEINIEIEVLDNIESIKDFKENMPKYD